MRRIILPVLLIPLCTCLAPAQEIMVPTPGSAVLVEDAKDWDGKTVRFTGEAIGEAMRRGTMAWIHLNDDNYGLAENGEKAVLSGANSGVGVWVDAALAARIAFFGDYRHHGDVVEATGTFHAACPLHGGDLDIHADTLRIVRTGHDAAHPVLRRRLAAAGIMTVLTGVLFLLAAIKRRRGSRDG